MSLVVALSLAAGAGLWRDIVRRRTRLATWMAAAERCGLTDVEPLLPIGSPAITAAAGSHRVRLSRYKRSERSGTRITVVPMKETFGVTLRLETFVTSMERRLGAAEIETGDGSFDKTFQVGGTPAHVFAALNERTRRMLESLAGQGRHLELSAHELVVELDEDHGGGPSAVPHQLALVLEVAGRLTDRTDLPGRLAENARDDSHADVRLNNLMILAREFADRAIAQEALRNACTDRSPENRLRAAMALGDEGRPVLRELLDSDADDLCVARAVSQLGGALSADRVRSVLDRALRGRCFETARACLSLLGRAGDADSLRTLAKVLSIERQGELGVAAAAALGVSRLPQAEAFLVEALRYESAELRIVAAAALGHTGSAGAVLPLKEAAHRDPRDRELGRATRQAVAQIQSRLSGAAPGQLSLSAAACSGQLALAESEAGRVSLPRDDAGRLSVDDSKGRD